jgi:hypothetical protein
MSDRKHRSSGGGRKWLPIAGWGLAVLLLGGNIVLALAREKDETPQGFLTPALLRTVAFWLPVLVAFAMSLAGMFWTSKALSHNERASLLWMRRGFVFALVGTVVLVFACFDPEMFPREWLAVIAAALLGALTFHFAFAAWKEYQRAEMGPGHRRRSRSESSSFEDTASSMSADAAQPDR